MADSKKVEQVNFDLIDKERNIYELAELFEQNRNPVSSYLDILQDPDTGKDLTIDGDKLICESAEYKIENDVAYFAGDYSDKDSWGKLNEQFLNYHKSLSVYTLLNSSPIVNYLSRRTGFGDIKNKRVLDVGGGTGHTFATFFKHSETLDYFLVDPNLRLLHDQFIRIYPKLTEYKMNHLIAKGENLPFKNDTFDFLINISAIDHMEDHQKFIDEAFRVLRPGGQILISSHLDIPYSSEDKTSVRGKVFSASFWERVARYLYYRKHAVGSDDHTLHIEDEKPVTDALEKSGFHVDEKEIFKRYFFVIATKPS